MIQKKTGGFIQSQDGSEIHLISDDDSTVESWFKVFPNLMFIFGVLAKAPYTQFNGQKFSPHISPYNDLMFMLHLRAIICSPLVYTCYCLLKISFHDTGCLASKQYAKVFTDLEQLAERSHTMSHQLCPLGGYVNICAAYCLYVYIQVSV
jgi:hypothetical protein